MAWAFGEQVIQLRVGVSGFNRVSFFSFESVAFAVASARDFESEAFSIDCGSGSLRIRGFRGWLGS